MSALSMTAWTQGLVKPVAGTNVKPTASGSVKPAAASTVKPVLNPSTTPVLKNAPTMITGAQSISGVIPAEGPRATAITISGQKFGTVQSDVQVKINGVSAIITGMSDNQITCVVPDRCGSGAISVAVKGKWVSGGYFQYDWAANFSTFAPTAGSSVGMQSPHGIARDAAGYLYVADAQAQKIFKVNNFGEVSVLAGSGASGFADGQGAAAQFYNPAGVAVDGSGNVYVTDYSNYRVRKITPSGMVSTLAGSSKQGYVDGAGVTAQFGYIYGICTDPSGNIYVIDGSRIRKITPQGYVSTVAGTDRWNSQLTGPALSVSFLNPTGILVSSSHDIYVTDGTNLIRKISASGTVTTVAGSGQAGLSDGYGTDVKFQGLSGIAMDATGNLYVTETNSAYDVGNMASRIRKIARDGAVSTPTGQTNNLSSAHGLVIDPSGAIYVADAIKHCIRKITLQ